jgi:IgA peptidase M64
MLQHRDEMDVLMKFWFFRLALAGAFVGMGLLFPRVVSAYEIEEIRSSGDPSNRIDLAVLGDGYRVEDQAQMVLDTTYFIEQFFMETPFAQYQDFFNVKLVHVISNQNGGDFGDFGEQRDTALGAEYNCYGIERLLCVDEAVVLEVVADHVPEYDYVFVLVNDTKYGGSGGLIPVFSTTAVDYGAAEHEFGHSAAILADEYESFEAYPECNGECLEPNVTIYSDYGDIKWNSWIDQEATPLPTPETSLYDGVIGAFEGARYVELGVFRPQLTCTMRALGFPFCAVCSEALVLAVYDTVEPIDDVFPSGEVVDVEGCDPVDFSVEYPIPVPDTMAFTWTVNGQVESTKGAVFTAEPQDFKGGEHEIKVVVRDATELVRDDYIGMLKTDFSWKVWVALPDGGCETDADKDAGAGANIGNDSGSGSTGDGGIVDASRTDAASDSQDSEGCSCRTVLGAGPVSGFVWLSALL